MSMLKFCFYLRNTLPNSTLSVIGSKYFFLLIKILHFSDEVFWKLSKPLMLSKKISSDVEMLHSLLDSINFKKYLFKLVYFVLPSPVPIIPLLVGSNK